MPVPATTISRISCGYYNSSASIGESGYDFSAFNAAISNLSTPSLVIGGGANVTKISSVTFATGVLGHLATNSSTTTFAFPGCPAATAGWISVCPESSLSTAFFVANSFISTAAVGAIQLNNVASIATLSPKVWRAVAYTIG